MSPAEWKSHRGRREREGVTYRSDTICRYRPLQFRFRDVQVPAHGWKLNLYCTSSDLSNVGRNKYQREVRVMEGRLSEHRTVLSCPSVVPRTKIIAWALVFSAGLFTTSDTLIQNPKSASIHACCPKWKL